MTTTKFNEIFLFVYLPQLVDAWSKFAHSASKVIMLRHNRNSRQQENLFIYKQSPKRKLESCESRFCEKMEVTRVPLGRPSRTTSGVCTTGWEPLIETVI